MNFVGIPIEDYIEFKKTILKKDFDNFKLSHNRDIVLSIINVGNNDTSNIYIKGKVKDGAELGVNVNIYKLDDNISKVDLLQEIELVSSLSDGVILQLPLPDSLTLTEQELSCYIPSEVDVDGFSFSSFCTPCTPKGIIDYLKFCRFDFENKNAVIIGRSLIVGKPMAKALLKENCNVTILHSHTSKDNLKRYIRNADLIITATGQPHLLTKEYKYKKDCIIMDVGINRDENNKLCGDCDKDLPVKFQSPVPKGVGLLTRLAIYYNLKILLELNADNHSI